MLKRMKKMVGVEVLFVAALVFSFHGTGFGFDITDKFSIGGILAGAYQYQWVNDGYDDLGRAALPFQPEFSFRPTASDEIHAKFGFAAGNGLNGATDFILSPWAADLEDDVKDINGRNRDYLLTAWYKHTFEFGDGNSLGLSGGLVDATDYIDQNAYANDEFTQFMNAALVNGPSGFAPSYDLGAAFEWETAGLNVNGVGMNVGENDDGNNYNFFAAQIGYKLNSALGEGNYRLVGKVTSREFQDPDGEDKEHRAAVLLSFDQAFGDTFGAWIRFEWQKDKAAVLYEALYSGGINITGKWYGREADNIGIGYAYLTGGNLDIDSSQVAEAYWRFALNQYFAFTLDAQYIHDKYDSDTNDPEGFIGSVRMTAVF